MKNKTKFALFGVAFLLVAAGMFSVYALNADQKTATPKIETSAPSAVSNNLVPAAKSCGCSAGTAGTGSCSCSSEGGCTASCGCGCGGSCGGNCGCSASRN